MHWLYLFFAGVLEVVWAVGLKASHGMTRPLLTALTIVAMLASVFFLSLAMKVLPLGTAYAVWTGVGALGAALLGIVLYHEPMYAGRMLGLGLIFAGIVCLKLTDPA